MRQPDSQALAGVEPEDLFFPAPDVAEGAFSGLPDPGPEWHLPGNVSPALGHLETSSKAMGCFEDAQTEAEDRSELGDFSDLLDSFAQFLDREQGLAGSLVDASIALPDEELFSGAASPGTDSDISAALACAPPSPAATARMAFAGSSGSLSLSRITCSSSRRLEVSLSNSHDGGMANTHKDSISETSEATGGGSSGVPSPSANRRRSDNQSSSSSNSSTSSGNRMGGVQRCAVGFEAGSSGPSLLDKLKNLVKGSSVSVASAAATVPAPSQASLAPSTEEKEAALVALAPEGGASLGREEGDDYWGLLLEDALDEEDSKSSGEVKCATQLAVQVMESGGMGEEVQEDEGAKKDNGEEVEGEGDCSPGSGHEEQQRQQRLLRNRQSALQSRRRRKMYVTELEQRCRMLEVQLGQMRQIVAMTALENGALRDQVLRLQQQLPAHNQTQAQPQKQTQTETQRQLDTKTARPSSPSSPPLPSTITVTATSPAVSNGSPSSLVHSVLDAAVFPASSHSNATSQSWVSGVPGSQGGMPGVSVGGNVGVLGSAPAVVQQEAEPAVLESDPLQSGSLLPHPLLAACLALHLSLLSPLAFSLCTTSASHVLMSVLACLFPPPSALSRGPSPVSPLHPCGPPLPWGPQEVEQGHGAGRAGRPVPSWPEEVGVAERARASALSLPRHLPPLIPLAQLCQPVTPVLVV